jgi:hypothetical protein
LPVRLVLARRILALSLVRVGRILALCLIRTRLASAHPLPLAHCSLLLRATRGKSAARCAAATGKTTATLSSSTATTACTGAATAASASATTTTSRIHFANKAQNKKPRNQCRPDTTP